MLLAQAYQANTITIDKKSKDFLISKSNTWSKYNNLYSLYKKAETPLEWFPKVFKFCKNKLNCFCFCVCETNLKV